MAVETFSLDALRQNGTGIANAQVRILNASGVDVTSVLFGVASGRTDATGNVTKWLTSTDRLPVGQTYTIQVIATGFQLWETTTSTGFNGDGSYLAYLIAEAASNDYTITAPGNGPFSSMAPIVCSVESPNTTLDWEIIAATVTGPDGSASIIQAPIDKVTNQAVIDFRNRVKLGVRPLLVPGDDLSREDTDFSTYVDVSFSSIRPEEQANLSGSFRRAVAQTLPPDGQDDLSVYTLLTNQQQWIVPSEPVLVFRGFYRDVMFWLQAASLPGYTMQVQYYDYAGTLTQTTTDAIAESDYVQRYRINTNPDDTTQKMILTILSGASPVSKPLTVLFRD